MCIIVLLSGSWLCCDIVLIAMLQFFLCSCIKFSLIPYVLCMESFVDSPSGKSRIVVKVK